MLKYTLQRILTFIPMLIAISLLSFVISINAPGDPVERLAKSAESEGSAQEQSGASTEDWVVQGFPLEIGRCTMFH